MTNDGGPSALQREIEARKAAEAALCENNEELLATLNIVGDGVVVTDVSGRITRMNPLAEKLTGWSAVDAHGRPLSEVFGVLDGTVAEIRTPLRDADGNPRGAVLAFRDLELTKRRRAERAPGLSEDQLALAQRAAQVAAFEWNVQTNTNTWTPELEAMYGLAPGDFGQTLQSWEDLVHPDDRAAAFASVNKALETFAPVEGEWRVVWKDGTVRWLAGRFQALKDDAGKLHRLIGVNLDITERTRAEAAVRASEEDLRITLQSIGDAVIATDARGSVTKLNAVAQQLTGWTLDEARGRPLQEVFRILNEDTREPVESPVDRVLREGVVVGLANHTVLVSRDGTERAIADSGAPVRDEAGALRGVVLVFRDQSEDRKAKRLQEQAAERLQILAESSQQFASITSVHELAEAVARRLGEVVGEGSAVRLLARDGGVFQSGVTATFHPDPVLMEEARQHAANQPLRLGEGVTGRVALSGEPLLFPVITTAQILAQTPPEYHPFMKRNAISSLLAVPLRAAGRVIGVISMSRRDVSRPFTVGDQRLVQDVADRAALAIENAVLVAELEERVVALRKSEARFRRLTESGIIGITVSNLAGRIDEANDAFLSMVGYSRQDFVAGEVTGQTVGSADREVTDAAALASLRADGIARPWERVFVHKDGRRIPALVGAAKIDVASNETIAFILDLRERKNAEAKARESEARKAAVMETALDAIVLMDHEGKITEFNPAAERTFGYARAEVLGRPLAELLIPARLRAQHGAGLQRYLETGEATILGRRIELPALTKSGTEFPAELAVVRIRSEGPAVFTGYIRDITERRQAGEAEALRREKEAAQAANRELEAFSYSVAHDLRAPLRGINGFSGALLEDHGPELHEDAKAHLHRIIAASERMGHIIDALLSLARVSRAELRRETVDLTVLARAVMQQLRATEPRRSVELVATDGVSATGDSRLLRAVLENLLGNAWKFTRGQPHARIELGCTLVADAMHYYVRDNGAGFDMTYASRLFNPFQRLHSTREFEGTGVGLATVQRIILRHGGRVWAEGKVAEGATFHFTLPAESSTG